VVSVENRELAVTFRADEDREDLPFFIEGSGGVIYVLVGAVLSDVKLRRFEHVERKGVWVTPDKAVVGHTCRRCQCNGISVGLPPSRAETLFFQRSPS